MAENRVIGRGNGLPWRLPDDMRHFMDTTMGHPVIMGRRTFESMRKPLPGRANIVLTGRPGYAPQGALVAGSFDAGLAIARGQCALAKRNTAYVIGGARVYEAGLAVATRLHVTWIEAEIEGDTWFPEVDWHRWKEVASRRHDADTEHHHAFRIAEYIRRGD